MAHPLTRPNDHRRSAFTLIELLVVVSIIALLIGILLPTLGEARRQAGIVACVATIRSNGQGIASYTTDNQDRLPTAPEGNGSATGGDGSPNTGPPGKPAVNFANSADNYLNGWRFNTAERPHGILYNPSTGGNAASNLQGMEAFWFIAFGNYMTETAGEAMLQEPFVSPTDRATKAYWNTYRGLPLSERMAGTDGRYLRPPSYWYILSAQFNRNLFRLDGPFGDAGGGGGSPQFQRNSVFHRSNEVAFPSSKVAFYQAIATHDGGQAFWNDRRYANGRGPATSIAQFDGSAKNIRCYDEKSAIPLRLDHPNEDAGPVKANGVPGELNNGWYYTGGDNKAAMFFRFTWGGLSGRDLP